ncbi:hypothetical protein [Pantoea sp. CCBC3-3-1]|uniref:hypothetical protein n=1 Tax=Pantoea sp. CCBC3-3-1 TaxID=2490851 RepID=UPI00143D6CC7|nr:hypothetical protein [Pantoea sp. CCBC3-3-1]
MRRKGNKAELFHHPDPVTEMSIITLGYAEPRTGRLYLGNQLDDAIPVYVFSPGKGAQ